MEVVECWLGIAGSVLPQLTHKLYLLLGCCQHCVDFLIYFFYEMPQDMGLALGFCASLS